MARWCIDLSWGGVKHFPAGTYYEQVATEWGRLELEMMDLVIRVREVYCNNDMSNWTPAQIDLAAWVEKG